MLFLLSDTIACAVISARMLAFMNGSQTPMAKAFGVAFAGGAFYGVMELMAVGSGLKVQFESASGPLYFLGRTGWTACLWRLAWFLIKDLKTH